MSRQPKSRRAGNSRARNKPVSAKSKLQRAATDAAATPADPAPAEPNAAEPTPPGSAPAGLPTAANPGPAEPTADPGLADPVLVESSPAEPTKTDRVAVNGAPAREPHGHGGNDAGAAVNAGGDGAKPSARGKKVKHVLGGLDRSPTVAGVASTLISAALLGLLGLWAFGDNDEPQPNASAATASQAPLAAKKAPPKGPVKPSVDEQAMFSPVRQVSWCPEPNRCAGTDRPALNSIIDMPKWGDERNFFDGKDNAIAGSGGYSQNVRVHDGQWIVLRVYYANSVKSGPPDTDAKNVRLSVKLPATTSQGMIVPRATLSSSNTSPAEVSDGVRLYGEREFTLEYVPDTTYRTWRPGGVGDVRQDRLADTITGSGVALGDVSWNPATSGVVTFKVKVRMPVSGPVAPQAPPAFADVQKQLAFSGPSRPEFRCDASSFCPGSPYVTLNSFTNDPDTGNEWNFLRAQTQDDFDTTGVSNYTSQLDVVPGDRVFVFAQMTNNYDARAAQPSAVTLARDVRAHFTLPERAARSAWVHGLLSSRTARPRSVYASMRLRSDQPFRIRRPSEFRVYAGEKQITGRALDRMFVAPETQGVALTASSVPRGPVVVDRLRPGRAATTFVRFALDIEAG